MKVSVSLNLSQQLTLTPQLQQAIRLLQLSTLDLNQEIQQAIETNPMLELAEGSPELTMVKKSEISNELQKEVLPDAQWSDYYSSSRSRSNSSEDAPNYENFYGTTTSLHDHLMWQCELSPFSPTDQMIVFAVIDAINDDGFLTLSAEEIRQSLDSEEHPIDLDEVLAVIHRIQRFDPVGCACQDLSECLLVQLQQLPSDTPLLSETAKILSQDLESLAQHNYKQVMKTHGLNEDQLSKVLSLIQTLNPKPGTLIDNGNTEYVIPDVVITKKGNGWHVELNPEAVPRLKINNNYASLIQRANNSSDNVFLKNNLQEARWFLKSLKSRQDTLLKVATSIMERQQDFLEHGEEAMKPMILNDVASDLEMHESTISRVTTQKYIHTPRGVFELKYFFSSHVNTASGGECSSTAIRALIKKLIAAENTKKPLSDNKIALLMDEQGIKVARRTIAKYRESMGIPPSNERKSINR